jgi:hypothetical protein
MVTFRLFVFALIKDVSDGGPIPCKFFFKDVCTQNCGFLFMAGGVQLTSYNLFRNLHSLCNV